MCQMCDEYENELVRMGLIVDARKFREERDAAHAATAPVSIKEGQERSPNPLVVAEPEAEHPK